MANGIEMFLASKNPALFSQYVAQLRVRKTQLKRTNSGLVAARLV
jgi:hypothetical protein